MLSDTIAMVLKKKGDQVYSTSPDEKALDAVALMAGKGVAAVMVISDGRPGLSPPRTLAGAWFWKEDLWRAQGSVTS